MLIKGGNPVLADLVSAPVMSLVSIKAYLETVVTALFVLVGVKVVSALSGLLPLGSSNGSLI